MRSSVTLFVWVQSFYCDWVFSTCSDRCHLILLNLDPRERERERREKERERERRPPRDRERELVVLV